MPGRKLKDEPVNFSALDPLKLLSDERMVGSSLVPRVAVLGEADQALTLLSKLFGDWRCPRPPARPRAEPSATIVRRD